MFYNLFDGHDELLVYPSDLNLLYAYFPEYLNDKYTNKDRFNRLDVILFKDLELQLKSQNVNKNIDILEFKNIFFKKLEITDLCNMRSVITKLMDSFSEIKRYKNRIPVIKETSIEIYSNDILNWFPESKFLHLVRDPRDNFAALKSGVKKYYSKMGEDEKQTLSSLIYRTRLGLKMGLSNQELYGITKYRFVIFNEVIDNTLNEIENICEFLGIEFNDKLLIPTRLGSQIRGNNFDGNKFNTITNKNVGRWIERISEDEAKVIEFHLGELMKKFNFNLKYDSSESAAAAAEFYKWENYKYYFSDRFKNL